MTTIYEYLSLSAQVAKSTFFMKSPVSILCSFIIVTQLFSQMWECKSAIINSQMYD